MNKNKNHSHEKTKLSETFLQKEVRKKEVKSKKLSRKDKNKKKHDDSGTELPFFRSCIKIQIEGYNQNRLISSFLKEKIKINAINKKSQKLMDIVIDVKNKQKGIALIEKLCYNYNIVEVSGTKPAIKWLLARIGIFAGAVIFTVIAVMSNAYIWKIDISGNDKVDDLTIMRELSDVKVEVGQSKKFDAFAATQTINGLDGIVECTIEVVGTTVKVKVIESKDFIPPNNDNTPRDIVSLYDAEVTRITVSGGTGKVRIGDRVPMGSVLISREALNSNGEVVGETKAKGSVYGKVIFSDTAIISTTTEETIRTGKKSKMTSLKLWGINIKGKNKNKFSVFESVTTESYAFYNTFLPITVNQTTFYEIEKKLVERPIEELVDEYKREKLLSLIINAGGSEITTTITKEEMSQGLYRVHLYMEAEMLISQFVT